MKYTVYFEIFGKYMKHTIDADNEEQAKYMVLGKVKFHKVEEIKDVDKGQDMFNKLFGGFK